MDRTYRTAVVGLGGDHSRIIRNAQHEERWPQFRLAFATRYHR